MTPPPKPPAAERELPFPDMLVPSYMTTLARAKAWADALTDAQLAALGLQRLALPESRAGETCDCEHSSLPIIDRATGDEMCVDCGEVNPTKAPEESGEVCLKCRGKGSREVRVNSGLTVNARCRVCRGTGRTQAAKSPHFGNHVDTWHWAETGKIRDLSPPHETGRSQGGEGERAHCRRTAILFYYTGVSGEQQDWIDGCGEWECDDAGGLAELLERDRAPLHSRIAELEARVKAWDDEYHRRDAEMRDRVAEREETVVALRAELATEKAARGEAEKERDATEVVASQQRERAKAAERSLEAARALPAKWRAQFAELKSGESWTGVSHNPNPFDKCPHATELEAILNPSAPTERGKQGDG